VRIYVRGRGVVAHSLVCVLFCVSSGYCWFTTMFIFRFPHERFAPTAADSVLAALLNTLLLNVNVDGDFFYHVKRKICNFNIHNFRSSIF